MKDLEIERFLSENKHENLSEHDFDLYFPSSVWISFLGNRIVDNPAETSFWENLSKEFKNLKKMGK